MERHKESGIALLSAILILMLMSAMLVGFVAYINADQLSSGTNRDQTTAYAAAHAGVEKLTADLGQIFMNGNYSPTNAQVNVLTTPAMQPVINGAQFVSPGGGSGYQITFTDNLGANGLPPADGFPDLADPNGTQIANGAYQGLVGLITPYTIQVTARTAGNAEVRMQRVMQTIAIPVFQFGIYSENDLSFFAGPNFQFGGRVHSNQNLHLAQQTGATLTLQDRVTTFGEIVRTHLANGQPINVTNHQGDVRMATNAGCLPPPAAMNNCRLLTANPNEGSLTIGAGGPFPPAVLTLVDPGPPAEWDMTIQPPHTPMEENAWTNLSIGQYQSYYRNRRTGVRRLELPIVDPAAVPPVTAIEIIKRPRPGDPTGPGTPFRDRFFRLASLRILLSDTAGQITNLPTVTPGAFDLSTLVPGAAGFNPPFNVPMSRQPGGAGVYLMGAANPRPITGWIKIEKQTPGGGWQDVTMEILSLGVTGPAISNSNWDVAGNLCVPENPSPNAVIRLQRVIDNPSLGQCGQTPVNTWSGNQADYMPLALYDTREGARRNGDVPINNRPYLSGIMHYIELDVNNLRRWFLGNIGANGTNTMNETGYVVYFSDRRGNKNWGPDELPFTLDDIGADGVPNTADDLGETGEFGFEDIVNRQDLESDSDGVLGPGEDFNGDGVFQRYGGTASPLFTAGATAPLNNPTVRSQLTARQARVNPPAFFRRALKLVNGARGQLPFNGSQGLTVAAETPVYVQGNFNACNNANAACAGGAEFEGAPTAANPAVLNPVLNPPHRSAAVIADSVTFLSWQWNDMNSFIGNPHSTVGRQAQTTWYRLGIIAGKGLNFMRPNPAAGTDHQDFGTDGGAHNFIRYIEDWNGGGVTLNYRGSLVSLYTSRQGTGTYKCCGNVYDPPNRGYNFEQEFLNPNLLPPRTPMFRDLNTLTFRQILRPTQ